MDALLEQTRSPSLLTDTVLVQLALTESEDASGVVKLRGEFARPDVPTANRRVYPRKLLQRELGRLQESINKRSLFGHLDHPDQGGTKLMSTAMVITGLRIEGDIVVGEGEILDTTPGRELKAILKAGCRVGVSSRGYGSTREDSSGNQVVQDDFRLSTYDVVADPADGHAYPDIIRESTEAPNVYNEEQIRAEIERVRLDERAATEQRMEREQGLHIADVLAVVRVEAEEAAHQRLLKDPRNATAHQALQAIKEALLPFVMVEDEQAALAGFQQRVQELETSLVEAKQREASLTKTNEELVGLVKTLGGKLYLERELGKDPNRSLIEKVVGDVAEYKDLAALKGKVEEVRKRIQAKDQELEKLSREAEKERARAEEERARADQAEEDLRKATQDSHVRTHLEQRLLGDPDAPRLRKLVRAAGAKTPAAVDRILSEARSSSKGDGLTERVQRRVQRGTGSTALHEEAPSRRSQETPSASRGGGYNGTGVPVSTFKGLLR